MRMEKEDDMEDILEEEWDLFKENVKAAVEKDPELPKGFESPIKCLQSSIGKCAKYCVCVFMC